MTDTQKLKIVVRLGMWGWLIMLALGTVSHMLGNKELALGYWSTTLLVVIAWLVASYFP